MIKSGKFSGVCKLDIEKAQKAYDHVNWDLIYVMPRMGFWEKRMGWSCDCISSTSFAVLADYSPTGFFPASNFGRQWVNPLPTPFFFG